MRPPTNHPRPRGPQCRPLPAAAHADKPGYTATPRPRAVADRFLYMSLPCLACCPLHRAAVLSSAAAGLALGSRFVSLRPLTRQAHHKGAAVVPLQGVRCLLPCCCFSPAEPPHGAIGPSSLSPSTSLCNQCATALSIPRPPCPTSSATCPDSQDAQHTPPPPLAATPP